jgi:hypothetical protein
LDRQGFGSSSFFFAIENDVVFLARSVTFRPQPTTSGRLFEKRHRQRVVDTG